MHDDVDLNFWVDGITPAGQLGYKETHYKILFDDSTLMMSESLAKKVFKKEQSTTSVIDKDTATTKDLQKLKKSELLSLLVHERRQRSK